MKSQKSLSQYGVGPYYVVSICGLTAAALGLNHFKMLPVFQLPKVELLLKGIGVLLAACGVSLWLSAVFSAKIVQHIKENELVTTGVYAWVRNPIYSAIMFLMWALLCWGGNLLLLVLCPVYHVLMMFMVKYTEERWLTNLYGEQYHDYCKRVNRCIPWPPKK